MDSYRDGKRLPERPRSTKLGPFRPFPNGDACQMLRSSPGERKKVARARGDGPDTRLSKGRINKVLGQYHSAFEMIPT